MASKSRVSRCASDAKASFGTASSSWFPRRIVICGLGGFKRRRGLALLQLRLRHPFRPVSGNQDSAPSPVRYRLWPASILFGTVFALALAVQTRRHHAAARVGWAELAVASDGPPRGGRKCCDVRVALAERAQRRLAAVKKANGERSQCHAALPRSLTRRRAAVHWLRSPARSSAIGRSARLAQPVAPGARAGKPEARNTQARRKSEARMTKGVH